MSKMAEPAMTIEDMYYDLNLDAHQIAKLTGCPVEHVAAYIDDVNFLIDQADDEPI